MVAAHPDDETIGAGRLVASYAGRVRAVTLSAGERCVVSPELSPSELAGRRLEEWRSALAELGAEPCETPRWPDGGLAAYEGEMATALADLVSADDAVVALWRHDPHPDHAAVGRAAAIAAERVGVRLVEYPVWAPLWMSPEEVEGVGYALRPVDSLPCVAARRSAALAAYVSQTTPLLPGHDPVVPEALLEQHRQQLLACRLPTGEQP